MQTELKVIDGTLLFNGAVLATGIAPSLCAYLQRYLDHLPRRGIFWADDLRTGSSDYFVRKTGVEYGMFKSLNLDSGKITSPIYAKTEAGNYRHAFPTRSEAEGALAAYRNGLAVRAQPPKAA